jgi:hypothetical protein
MLEFRSAFAETLRLIQASWGVAFPCEVQMYKTSGGLEKTETFFDKSLGCAEICFSILLLAAKCG